MRIDKATLDLERTRRSQWSVDTLGGADVKCKRCDGEGQTEIDRLPGVPEEDCHRCNGTGIEPPISLLVDYKALMRWLSQDENSAACEAST